MSELKGFDFQRMRMLIRKIPEIEFRIEKARSKAEKITTVITGMPHGSGGTVSQVESGAIKIAELVEAYKDVLDELATMRSRLEPMIKKLNNPNIRAVMKLRYINGHSINQIANAINYSEMQVFRFLRRGEAEIQKDVSEC